MNPQFVLIVCLYFCCFATGQRLAEINAGAGDLSIQLLKRHVSGDKNTVHSAYSISSALGMCLLGAQEDTLKAMRNTMGLASLTDEEIKQAFKASAEQFLQNNGFVLKSANRLYVDETFPLRSSFQKEVNEIFHADIHNVDFKGHARDVQQEINSFVKNRTEGLIPKILSSEPSPDSTLLVVNALYFKGTWLKKMTKAHLSDEFNAHTCESAQPMLTHQKAKWIRVRNHFRYTELTSLQADLIELPYAPNDNLGQKASMIVILPQEQHKCNIPGWAKQHLKWSSVVEAVAAMQPLDIELTMPEIEIEAEFELKNELSELGMAPAFSGAANFNGMVEGDGGTGIQISEVIHKAKMIVDEKGTEAAAATAVQFTRKELYQPLSPAKQIFVKRSFAAIIVVKQSDGSIVPLFTSVVNKV